MIRREDTADPDALAGPDPTNTWEAGTPEVASSMGWAERIDGLPFDPPSDFPDDYARGYREGGQE